MWWWKVLHDSGAIARAKQKWLTLYEVRDIREGDWLKLLNWKALLQTGAVNNNPFSLGLCRDTKTNWLCLEIQFRLYWTPHGVLSYMINKSSNSLINSITLGHKVTAVNGTILSLVSANIADNKGILRIYAVFQPLFYSVLHYFTPKKQNIILT